MEEKDVVVVVDSEEMLGKWDVIMRQEKTVSMNIPMLELHPLVELVEVEDRVKVELDLLVLVVVQPVQMSLFAIKVETNGIPANPGTAGQAGGGFGQPGGNNTQRGGAGGAAGYALYTPSKSQVYLTNTSNNKGLVS